jgi:site-specific DNA recombinase
MLARLAEDRSIDSLVVHKLDRLARNLEDHAAVRAALREAGVQLHSVTESLEDSASGKLVEGILAPIAEFYSANLGQEIRKGMDQKAAQGGWPVRAPFGYRNVRRDGPGRRGESVLEPDPQAPLVVTIRVRDGAIADFTYEEPFGSLLGSHKGSMVEMMGLEPTTPCLQSRCSSN